MRTIKFRIGEADHRKSLGWIKIFVDIVYSLKKNTVDIKNKFGDTINIVSFYFKTKDKVYYIDTSLSGLLARQFQYITL